MSETSRAASGDAPDRNFDHLIGPSSAMAKAMIAIAEMSGLSPSELFNSAIAGLVGVASYCAKPGHLGPLLETASTVLRSNADAQLQPGKTVQ